MLEIENICIQEVIFIHLIVDEQVMIFFNVTEMVRTKRLTADESTPDLLNSLFYTRFFII